ncbi:MAG: hypothetical protein ACI4TC_06990, partial [Kiritimatiellia bacterium]
QSRASAIPVSDAFLVFRVINPDRQGRVWEDICAFRLSFLKRDAWHKELGPPVLAQLRLFLYNLRHKGGHHG